MGCFIGLNRMSPNFLCKSKELRKLGKHLPSKLLRFIIKLEQFKNYNIVPGISKQDNETTEQELENRLKCM